MSETIDDNTYFETITESPDDAYHKTIGLSNCSCSMCRECEFYGELACSMEMSAFAKTLLEAGKIDLQEGLEMIGPVHVYHE